MSKTFGEDFRKDVEIDRLKLEEECEVQPSMYYFYAEKLADARKARDKAKDRHDLVLGQRETYIRRNPPEDMKITEGVISALLVQDTEVQTVKEELRLAQAELDLLYAASSSMDQRSKSLDNLVTLWTKEYYNNKNKADEGSEALRGNLNRRNGKE